MKKLALPIIIVVLLLGAIIYYFLRNQPTKTPEPTPQPSPAAQINTIISNVAGGYYNSYNTCIKNPPEAAKGMVSVYCQGNTGLTTAAFAANLEKGGTASAGADPIFCAQSVPVKVTVDPDIQITDNKATAFINEIFGSNQIKIQVENR